MTDLIIAIAILCDKSLLSVFVFEEKHLHTDFSSFSHNFSKNFGEKSRVRRKFRVGWVTTIQ